MLITHINSARSRKAPNDHGGLKKLSALSETGSVMAASPLSGDVSGIEIGDVLQFASAEIPSAGRPLHALQRCQSLNTSLHKRALRKLLSTRFKQLRLRTIRRAVHHSGIPTTPVATAEVQRIEILETRHTQTIDIETSSSFADVDECKPSRSPNRLTPSC